jgi:hypothetical protein
VPLAKLRPEHLDALYARLLREGHDGRPLSGSTVRRMVRRVLRRPGLLAAGRPSAAW